MKRILVTGALGNVGHFVAKSLIDLGMTVTLADIDVDALLMKYGPDHRHIYFNFQDPTTFESALEGVTGVFLMRPPHLGKPRDLYPFLNAVKAIGKIELISFLSLIGIEHNPVPPHYKIEKYIQKIGLPYCHLRPSFFMQNLSGIHAFEIKYANRIFIPAGKARISFIDAKDIGYLAALVLSNPLMHLNKAYSITGPRALDYETIAQKLSQKLEREIIYVSENLLFSRNYWIRLRGIKKDQSTVMAMLYMMTRMGTADLTTGVYEDITGRQPTSIDEFIEVNLSAWL